MSKFKLEDLKKEYEDLGWTLLSEKYENLSSEMCCKCPEDHTVYLTYERWRKHHECPVCAKSSLRETKEFQVLPKPVGAKRLLAFDQATNTTGWAVFDDKKLVKYGAFTTNRASSVEKINEMKNWVNSMITNWRPDRVVIEDIQYQSFKDKNKPNGDNIEGVTTFKTLAHLQGVLCDFFYESKVTYDIAHTAVWREYNDVKGRSRSDKKRSAQLIVKDLYGISATQDEADAICIGRYGLSLRQELTLSEWI